MIYSINFMDMAEKINPLAFARYLVDTGWQAFPTKKTYINIYQYENNKDFYQVTVPLDKKLADYKQAMLKAVEVVSKKEGRSLEQVMLYLLNPNTDILKIRLDKPNIEAGNILFDDAIKMYENAKKLLAATALDILTPKVYHRGRLDDAVVKFLADCRFGQTEIGSYIVSVVCPFAELNESEGYKQLSIFSDEEQCTGSLTRQVTNKVMKNISTIKSHIDRGTLQELIEFNDDNIISANFFEALNGLNLEYENTGVEFIAEWSPVVKNREFIRNDILLTHDYYQPIATIIDKLKDNYYQPIEVIIHELKDESIKATKIIGRIKKLESSPIVEARTRGKVTIVYLDEESNPKTVTVQLDKNSYDKAILAYAEGKHVVVMGEWSSGKRSTMTCDSFNIID